MHSAASNRGGGWIEVTTHEQAKALDGKMVEVDAAKCESDLVRPIHGRRGLARLMCKGAYLEIQVPDTDDPLVWGCHDYPSGIRLRVVEESSAVDDNALPEIGRNIERRVRSDEPYIPVSELLGSCPTCMGAKVLKHIVPGIPDEPCPDCPPEPKQGPSEWTVVSDVQPRHDNPARFVTFARNNERQTFWIMCWSPCGVPHTDVGRPRHDADDPAMVKLAEQATIIGERCHEMAIARLLCGLQDGTVKP